MRDRVHADDGRIVRRETGTAAEDERNEREGFGREQPAHDGPP